MPYKIIVIDDPEEGGAPKGRWRNDLLDWTASFKERRGTASRRFVIDDADTNFIEYRFDSGSTSGDNRGIYVRLYFTGAGGGGETIRAYTDVVGVAKGTCHGAHLSLGFGEGTVKGSITGLGVAMRATLGLPNATMDSGGTYAAIQAEIHGFGSSCQPSGVTELSFIRVVAGGHSTARQEIDDKAYLLVLDGIAEGSNNMVVASANESLYVSAARCKINGVVKWLMFASDSG